MQPNRLVIGHTTEGWKAELTRSNRCSNSVYSSLPSPCGLYCPGLENWFQKNPKTSSPIFGNFLGNKFLVQLITDEISFHILIVIFEFWHHVIHNRKRSCDMEKCCLKMCPAFFVHSRWQPIVKRNILAQNQGFSSRYCCGIGTSALLATEQCCRLIAAWKIRAETGESGSIVIVISRPIGVVCVQGAAEKK